MTDISEERVAEVIAAGQNSTIHNATSQEAADAITALIEVAEALAERVKALEKENARLSEFNPEVLHNGMDQALIRAPAGEDWFAVIDALQQASSEMGDPEDTQHRVTLPYGAVFDVDFDAANGNPMNVYEIRPAPNTDTADE